jgi:SAM-dependent methyltransferase
MNPPATVILEDVDCPIGCPRDDVVVLSGRDLLHDIPGNYNVVKCSTCGLMRTTPRPTPATIGTYYPTNYGPYLGTTVTSGIPRSRPRQMLGRVVRRMFKLHTDSLPTVAPGRMLEIGCASGAFLHRMARRGWNVHGIEYSEAAAQRASDLGYQVHAGTLESAPSPQHPFDLIVGWMVLEHLHDPVSGLRKLREWATPGAWLVLSVPNAGSLEFQLFKRNWYALQVPTHLHHFTPKSVEAMLRATGWGMQQVHHQRLLGNLFASIGYLLREKGYPTLGAKFISFPERAGRWNYALFPVAWLLSLFGQTGRMTVWARAESVGPSEEHYGAAR